MVGVFPWGLGRRFQSARGKFCLGSVGFFCFENIEAKAVCGSNKES